MATKFSPAVGTSTKQKSRKASYFYDAKQTDARMKTPPTRKPGTSLGAGKQESVIQKAHSDTHPTLLYKVPKPKRVPSVPAPKPGKSKQIKTVDGVMPK
jgi:hypothetical protein